MTVLIPRLRRWFMASGIALVMLVAGAYFLARHKAQSALKQVPEKIGVEIQQSAKGFTISKSYEGRTLFKIEANKAVQFKQGSRGELHDVEITVYGRNSQRFDRISGRDFEYNSQTGDITGKGEIQIDLEANPSGIGQPDQSIPQNLRNPIHLTTSDLVFNQKTGDANSRGAVEFSLPQAHGSAEGLNYEAKSNRLTLLSQVVITVGSLAPITLLADRASLTKNPGALMVEHPHLMEGSYKASADNATVFFSQDNKIEQALAQGNVLIESKNSGKISAAKLELTIDSQRNTFQEAKLSGNVSFKNPDQNGLQGNAGEVVLHFTNTNLINKVRAEQSVTLIQHRHASAKSASQEFKITAPQMDFDVFQGKTLRRAETTGPPEMTIYSPASPANETTVLTAGKFEAGFDRDGAINKVSGAPDVRIVDRIPGKPDRVSTSRTLDAEFGPSNGLTILKMKGTFVYTDGQLQASGNDAQYLSDSQTFVVTGSARVADDNMNTTAQTIQLNRVTGQATAEGEVKTTYNAMIANGSRKPLASSDPIHITAGKMTAAHLPGIMHYVGNARLWQDANQIEAPEIELDRDRRSISANSVNGQRVSTRLFQNGKDEKGVPIVITSREATYIDTEPRVHFEGAVNASSADIRVSAAEMDCFLAPRSQPPQNHHDVPNQTSGVNKVVASGGVIVSQGQRRATGNRLVYTPADDKFVMTGGSPSIFDAEHGNVTGDSLTLFGHDGRVLVEGSKQSPAVTKARVAR